MSEEVATGVTMAEVVADIEKEVSDETSSASSTLEDVPNREDVSTEETKTELLSQYSGDVPLAEVMADDVALAEVTAGHVARSEIVADVEQEVKEETSVLQLSGLTTEQEINDEVKSDVVEDKLEVVEDKSNVVEY